MESIEQIVEYYVNTKIIPALEAEKPFMRFTLSEETQVEPTLNVNYHVVTSTLSDSLPF
jgi:hypothetical protein